MVARTRLNVALYVIRTLLVVFVYGLCKNAVSPSHCVVSIGAVTSSIVQQPNSGVGRHIVGVPRSHTIRHTHTPGRTPLNEWSARRRDRYVQHTTKETNIHALSGIRTRDPFNYAFLDLRLRPHGHRDLRCDD